MNTLIQTVMAVFVGVLLASTWLFTAMVVRAGEAFYYAIAAQYFLAALVGLVMQAAIERRLPVLNFKLLSSSITLGMICFFFPAVFTFTALKELPPAVAAMTFAMVPLWYWMFRIGRGIDRPIFFLAAIAGAVLYYVGTGGHEYIYGRHLYLIAGLLLSSFLFALGSVFCKKIFWIHSPKGLSFWAMMMAAFASCAMAWVSGEPSWSTWQRDQFLRVLYLGLVGTGLSAYAYRFLAVKPRNLPVLVTTIMMPLGSIGLTYLVLPQLVLWNAYSLSGLAIYIVIIALAARTESPAHWMSHVLNNSRRQGDRVICHIKGFMKKDKGSIAKIDVVDISIGGLGFKCDTEFHVADHVFITFPLGQNWTQITFECQIMHRHKTSDAEFPWSGGVEFRSLGEETRQTLVEFLARIGRPIHDAA